MLLFLKETKPKSIIIHEETHKQSIRFTLRVVIRDRIFLFYIVTGIIIFMGFSQSEGMLPLHFSNEDTMIFGNSNPFPYLMTLNGLLVVCFQFPISKWLTHKSIGKSMLYGAILLALAF